MGASPKYLWWNGQIVPWDDAQVHVTILGWSTIGAVFEGIKAYWNSERQELYALQFAEHYNRFLDSMRLQRMAPRWTAQELIEASLELLRANDVRQDAYVRPIAYFGETTWFSSCMDAPTEVFIWTTPFESVLGAGRTSKACVSSWTRLGDNMMSPRIKCLSNYQNSRMALIEAKRHGYNYPILLNDQQKVTEGPASCLFIVRDGVAITPAATSGILESITRRTLLQLCRDDLNIPDRRTRGRPHGTVRRRRNLLLWHRRGNSAGGRGGRIPGRRRHDRPDHAAPRSRLSHHGPRRLAPRTLAHTALPHRGRQSVALAREEPCAQR